MNPRQREESRHESISLQFRWIGWQSCLERKKERKRWKNKKGEIMIEDYLFETELKIDKGNLNLRSK